MRFDFVLLVFCNILASLAPGNASLERLTHQDVDAMPAMLAALQARDAVRYCLRDAAQSVPYGIASINANGAGHSTAKAAVLEAYCKSLIILNYQACHDCSLHTTLQQSTATAMM